MNILGISAYYHDSSACLLQDGQLIAAAQEERFTRIKNDPSFPTHAIQYCLEAGGIGGKQLDLVAFYEKPLHKLDRFLETSMCLAPKGAMAFGRIIPNWFVEKMRVEERVRRQYGFSGEFLYCLHHEAHAASAFFLSPFEEAAILSVDGVGEWTTNAIGIGQDSKVRLIQEIRFPHSLGLLYSAFTQFLGFKVNSGEYKVMGLAPYGEPTYVEPIFSKLIDVKEDGSYRLRMEHFAFLDGKSTINHRFGEVLGCTPRDPEGEIQQIHMDLANSIQVVTEEILLRQVRHAAKECDTQNLCMAGGVALNSVANGRIIKEGPFSRLWIQPAAGDAGGCLGAALVAWHHRLGNRRSIPDRDGMKAANLGPSFDSDRIGQALQSHGLAGEMLPAEELRSRVVDGMLAGNVIGWYQGRMEFGPRALGNRSILADPRSPQMQSRVNRKVKFREGFRPFAPAVLEDRVQDWFEWDQESPYMLLVVNVAEGKRKPIQDGDRHKTGLAKLQVIRSEIPAVTHVNYSARIQTIRREDNPAYYDLIQAFGEKTGCPVVLNTSFNLRGEPICCTPEDACKTFLASGLDALAIGPYWVERPQNVEPTGVPPPPPKFKEPVDPKQLRRFGWMGGLGFAILGGAFFWLERPWVALPLWSLAALIWLLAGVRPLWLNPLERVMGAMGKFISRSLSWVMLLALYWLVLTPLGWLRRWIAKDPLQRKIDPHRSSYWETIEPKQDRYDRMY